jgi:HEPN domain-containing protein
MQAATSEWLKKAEGDYVTAQRECRARTAPNFDAACFHAQQSAEKYLKGYLQELKIPFPKTHDLVRLVELVPAAPGLKGLRGSMAILSSYAVEFRYPGEGACREVAKEAIVLCRAIRAEVRGLLRAD